MAHLDSMLGLRAVFEIETYLQYRQKIGTEETDFSKTREFLKYFEEKYDKGDLSFDNMLWMALRKFTKKDIRTKQDLRQAWNSYQPDFKLLANSDTPLLKYGTNELPLERVKELSNLVLAVCNEFLDNGACGLFKKKYAA